MRNYVNIFTNEGIKRDKPNDLTCRLESLS